MQIGWQAAVGSRQVSANLHDGLARVDRTAGDTWRRQRGGGYIVSAGRVGIGKQKADGMSKVNATVYKDPDIFLLKLTSTVSKGTSEQGWAKPVPIANLFCFGFRK
ncbi:hypothetical protein APICC_04285 [Apis cerana cerana]|uniref:Uncharacterized protein n=1 Tax=Apis cerana cerana TaxID=94128 RepID=A0A2A3E6K3_APICC|nr:hypothetical protein APICC_04285 [Apis cerana cerana]